LCSIAIDFYIFIIRARLIKTNLNEICGEVRIVKMFSDTFTIQNVLKQGDAFVPMLFNVALEYGIRTIQRNQEG
jgi:hypothetical protein